MISATQSHIAAEDVTHVSQAVEFQPRAAARTGARDSLEAIADSQSPIAKILPLPGDAVGEEPIGAGRLALSPGVGAQAHGSKEWQVANTTEASRGAVVAEQQKGREIGCGLDAAPGRHASSSGSLLSLSTSAGMDPAVASLRKDNALHGAPQCPSADVAQSRALPSRSASNGELNGSGSSAVRGIEPVTLQSPRSNAPAGTAANLRDRQDACPTFEGNGDVAVVAFANGLGTDRSGNHLSSTHGNTTAKASAAGPSSEASEQFTEATDADSLASSSPRRAEDSAPYQVCADGPNTDEWRIAQANRRHELVLTYRALKEQGHSGKKAAELMGEDHVSLWRYDKAFEKSGYNGLVPNTDKCGRKSELDKLRELLGSDVVDELLAKIKGVNLDVKSTTAALRVFAHSDECPEELARIILDPNRCSKHALPPSLRRAATVPKMLRKAHEGPRSLNLGGIYTPRRVDILPGDIFSADDTTPIWGWWVPWIESEEYPFGVKLLQGQFIPVIDVASQAIVSFVLIAREKSSYRACDIWNLFGHTFETVGLPRLGWQLERGSWEANVIAGAEIEYREDEVTFSRRVGGLRQLPTNVTQWHRDRLGAEAMACFPKTLQTWTSFLPKSKSIEGWFNRNQKYEGTLWGSLGRDQMRAPYEKAKKVFQACQRGAEDPRNYFLSGTEIAARIKGIIDFVNSEPMEGEVFHGVPINRFNQATIEHPLMFLDEEQRWLYRHDWRTVQITKGYARVRLTHPVTGQRYSLFYNSPRFAEIDGAEVAVYFDRENFEAPAQILTARDGKFFCEAQYVERSGSFLEGDADGHDIRKQWRNAVMSIYGTIVNHAPSRQLPAEIAARRKANHQDTKGTKPEESQIEVRGEKPRPQPRKPLLPAPSPDEWARRREQLQRQAERANQLRGLTTNPE